MTPDDTMFNATFQHPFQPERTVCHIRGIVDDQYVVRWWDESRQRWNYECMTQRQIDMATTPPHSKRFEDEEVPR